MGTGTDAPLANGPVDSSEIQEARARIEASRAQMGKTVEAMHEQLSAERLQKQIVASVGHAIDEYATRTRDLAIERVRNTLVEGRQMVALGVDVGTHVLREFGCTEGPRAVAAVVVAGLGAWWVLSRAGASLVLGALSTGAGLAVAQRARLRQA